MELLNDAIIVSVDFTRGKDVGVMVVGRKLFGENADIINAFQGEEAYELYRKLVTKSELMTEKKEEEADE